MAIFIPPGTIPIASNELADKDIGILYEFRKYYKNEVYPGFSTNNKPIDLWYDKRLYGKVNLQFESLVATESRLKSFKESFDPVFAFDFVVEAYEELVAFINKLRQQNRIDARNSFLSELRVKKAWKSINLDYHEHMERVFRLFNQFLQSTRSYNKIKEFNDFLNIFEDFIEQTSVFLPITKTFYALSFYTGIEHTGLSVNLDLGLDSEDADKIKILRDPYFNLFVKLARNYGFYIDKNAPWRLICDIKNPATLARLKSKSLDVKSFFDTYYYKSSKLDIPTLQIYLIQFYNSIVNFNPIIKEQFYNSKNKLCFKHFVRTPVSYELVKDNFSDKFWIRIYLKIRLSEENLKWNKEKFNTETKKAFDILKYSGYDSSVRYIDRLFASVWKPRYVAETQNT